MEGFSVGVGGSVLGLEGVMVGFGGVRFRVGGVRTWTIMSQTSLHRLSVVFYQ